MGGLGVKVQHFPLTLLVVLTTLTLPCERDSSHVLIPMTPGQAVILTTRFSTDVQQSYRTALKNDSSHVLINRPVNLLEADLFCLASLDVRLLSVDQLINESSMSFLNKHEEKQMLFHKPNAHRRRRRDETVELRLVGVGGVYMNSQLTHDDCRRIR